MLNHYQEGPYYPYAPPPRKKENVWLIAMIACLVVAALLGIGVSLSGHGDTTVNNVTMGSDPPSSLTQEATTPAAPTSWKTIQTFSGSGHFQSAAFAVGDTWKILWSCDPNKESDSMKQAFADGYNVVVSVDGTDHQPFDLMNAIPINATCKTGETHGETNMDKAGMVVLNVISEDNWTIEVQEPTS